MLPRLYRTEIEIRKRQINTLKVFNDNVIEIQEGCEYNVLFKSGGNEMNMKVLLPNDFPNEKPFLKTIPAVIHPWVNSEGEITSAPGLLNFTVHSDLGRVVQAIIREFERNPPPLAGEQSASAITSPSTSTKVSDTMGKSQYNYSFSPPTNTLSIFPDLEKLSLDDLQFLNENDDKQEEFIDNLPHVKEANKKIDELLSQVEELADSNLGKKERLNELETSIESKIEEVTKLTFENERLTVAYQSLSDNFSPKNIKEQLRAAVKQSDTLSEQLSDNFLNGDIDLDKFLNMYIQTRSLSHMRKAKEEKLAQQLMNLEKAGF